MIILRDLVGEKPPLAPRISTVLLYVRCSSNVWSKKTLSRSWACPPPGTRVGWPVRRWSRRVHALRA